MYLEVHNKHYFSSTAKSGDYVNFFPELGFNWNMEHFIEEAFDKYGKKFSIYGGINRSIGESSLVFRNLSVLSTIDKAENFRNYFEYTNIFHHEGLKPETYLKSELGLRYSTASGNFNAELNGFYSQVSEQLVKFPILQLQSSCL